MAVAGAVVETVEAALDVACAEVVEVAADEAAAGLEELSTLSPELVGAIDEMLPICIAVSSV